MRAVVFTGAGGNEVVEIAERPDPAPEPHEVLVHARYAGLNPADLHQRQGRYPPPRGAPEDVPGLEVAGQVATVGAQVSRWQVGDRVMGLVAGGGIADRVVVDERSLMAVPDRIDDVEAAGIPECFLTAHDALRTQGGMRRGHVVLVHGATGGVGSAAVQLARTLGARVIGSTRSAAGPEFVERLGGEHVGDTTFRDEVLERTDGRGVDVVIELVGAPHFPANLEVLATRGTIVVVGIGAGSRIELALHTLIARRGRLAGTRLRDRPLEEKAEVVAAFAHDAADALGDRDVVPIIEDVVALSRVHEAFDRLEAGGRLGKLVLDLEM
jgi:NADPH:quinone reductase